MSIPSADSGRAVDGRDALTGLCDRNAALHRVRDRLRDGTADFAVLFCDLDGFKTVNDTRGHATGDTVLVQAAHRIQAVLPSGALAARIGGDEFLLVVPTAGSQHEAERVARTVVDVMADEFVVDGVESRLGVSVGIALPAPGKDAQRLVWDADIAMYTAKRNRLGVALYTPALDEENRNRQQLEVDLRRVVDRGGLDVAYQPIVAADTGQVRSVETLVRWNHPDRGPVSPAVFIPIAERLGLMDRVGEFVLDRALRDFATWAATGDPAPASVSVNVAASQLDDPAFADSVAAALARTGVPAPALTVEITESALVSDHAPGVLSDLADAGVRLDVDDFGTGYSSLAYLVRLPVHALKVDRTFVWGLEADHRLQTTVRAIVRLAHDLDLECVVEGVETDDQRRWLTGAGCDLLQGFAISRPVPADRVPGACATRRW